MGAQSYRKSPSRTPRVRFETYSSYYSPDIETIRREALIAAEELYYSDDIKRRIKNAKNEIQIQNALKDGRDSL